MKTSESIKTIAPALLAAKKAFKPALKTAENPAYKGSRYVDLQTVVEATETALSDNGLMLIQTPGTSEFPTMAALTSRLIHVSGEWIEDTLTIPAGTQNRYDAQTVGSAITYARRYSYMGILGIAPEDDDGSTASGSHVVQRPTPIRQQPHAQVNEDSEPVFDEDGDMVEAKATVQHREQKAARKPPAEKPTAQDRKAKGYISEAQEKRLIAIAKTNGKEWSEIDEYMDSIGLSYTHEIPWKGYDDAISWAGGKNERRA